MSLKISILAAMAALALFPSIEAAEMRTPVIVELFTSEGCSSCPPADDLLSRLAQTQPVGNAQIIALEEHVDYWNHLGWADPFSSASFSARQNEYANALRNSDVYTPQVLVNGHAQFDGGDARAASREVARAAAMTPLYSLHIQASSQHAIPQQAISHLNVSLRRTGEGFSKPADVFLAITEDGLFSKVAHGENHGRTLHHAPVVRKLQRIGGLDKRSPDVVDLTSSLEIAKDWKRDHLHAVVFVQNRDSRQITGAAEIAIPSM